MPISGDLRTFELSEILEWIARRHKSGRLTLRRLSTEKLIGFRNGRLRSSSSNDPRETLGQMLVRDQLVSEEDLFQALLRQEGQQSLLGEILVAEGRLTREALRQALQAQAEETVYAGFLWTDGHFAFEEGGANADAVAIELDMDPAFVAQEGLHRLEQWSQVSKRLPASASFRVPSGVPKAQDPVDRQLMALAASGRTLAAISLETRRSEFDTTLRLLALLQGGALARGPDHAEAVSLDPVGAIQGLLERANRLLAAGVFDGALRAYEEILAIDGLNQEAKKGLVNVADQRRRWKAASRLPLDSVPVLSVASMTLTRLQFEPTEGFVLSRINGQWSLRAILKLCPMAEVDVLAIVARLVDRGVVKLVADQPAPRRA